MLYGSVNKTKSSGKSFSVSKRPCLIANNIAFDQMMLFLHKTILIHMMNMIESWTCMTIKFNWFPSWAVFPLRQLNDFSPFAKAVCERLLVLYSISEKIIIGYHEQRHMGLSF